MQQISLYTKDQCEAILKPHGLALPTAKESRVLVGLGCVSLFRKVKSGGKIFYEMQHGATLELCKPENRIFHIDD